MGVFEEEKSYTGNTIIDITNATEHRNSNSRNFPAHNSQDKSATTQKKKKKKKNWYESGSSACVKISMSSYKRQCVVVIISSDLHVEGQTRRLALRSPLIVF